MAVDLDLHRLEFLALDGDALAQGFDLGLGRVAVHPDAIFAQPAGRGKLQTALEFAVVGQKEKTLGVEVKPSDRHHAGHVFGQVVKDGVAALFVRGRGHQPLGLVVKPQARGFGLADEFAPDGDLVAGGHVQRGRGDDLAVDADFAHFDHPFRLAPRGDACAGQDLGDAVAFGGVRCRGLCGGLFFCGHGLHPLARDCVASPGGFTSPDLRGILEDR